MWKKRLDSEDKFNFKIHDVAIHILPKGKQTMKQDKYFSSKIIQKMRQGDHFQPLFFKKA